MLAVAAAHLTLVVAGVKLRPGDGSFCARLLTWYQEISGASTFDTFFAPDVPPLFHVELEAQDEGGKTIIEPLEMGESRETSLRLTRLLSTFIEENRTLQSSLAVSCAGRMLARHPGATRLVVRLRFCRLPSTAEYHQGQRPAWETIYEATVTPRTGHRSDQGGAS